MTYQTEMHYLLTKDKNPYNVHIVSAGVSLLSFESDEYEIIRIPTTRREKIVPLID